MSPRTKKSADLDLQWVAPPKQARSQARFERMLDAAEQVIAERGFDRASVAEIMAKAGSSVGVFYQRFKTKDDLLRCLMARFTEESMATCDVVLAEEAWKGKSISAIIGRLVPFLITVYRERRGLIRALLRRASVDKPFRIDAHAAEQYVEDRLERLLMDRASEIHHPNPQMAVRLAYQMLRSTLNMLVLYELERRAGFDLDDRRLGKELSRAFLQLLDVEPTQRPRAEQNGKKKAVRKKRKSASAP